MVCKAGECRKNGFVIIKNGFSNAVYMLVFLEEKGKKTSKHYGNSIWGIAYDFYDYKVECRVNTLMIGEVFISR